MSRPPLTRDQVISVIEGRSEAPRVPMMIHFWVLFPEEFKEQQAALSEILNRYPMDTQMVYINMPGGDLIPAQDPTYRWFPFDDPYQDIDIPLDDVPWDERVALPGWDLLDAVLGDFADPYHDAMLQFNVPPDDRYRLGYWWFWLFERHWAWRGMTKAMMDYYDHPQEVHRMFRAVTDFYSVALERAKTEMAVDGVMISDDLGHQTDTFFSPRIFDEFYRPYYQELIEKAHALGLHIWLHACGCLEAFLPAFVEMGLDAIHPIQKYTMDQGEIANRFGSQISFWAGMDMQQILPWGTPEDVRQEVRYLIDTFNRPDGRLLLAAGNAIHPDSSLPNIEAFLDEAYNYGTAVVRPQ